MRHVLIALVVLAVSAAPGFAVDKEAINSAIEKGVAALKKMQLADGYWENDKIGPTALAGLTLLECGVDKDDKSITKAADAVRKVAMTTLHTYSLSLCILFLDRLGNDSDTPLIEAMIVNLVAGQTAGGWGYYCKQAFAAEDQKELTTEASGRVLRGRRDLTKLPTRGKRSTTDTAKVVQAKIEVLAKLKHNRDGLASTDNSNTQFANLALWVGRRYGVPTQDALLRIDARYRELQDKDGGWSYRPNMPGYPYLSSSAPMTCAGLLGLACGHGAKADNQKEKGINITKDVSLRAGLQMLATAVGTPIGWDGKGKAPKAISQTYGPGYYWLWSLERVCVLLKMETIGKKDWYNWGAEILLANQDANGAWTNGEYATNGADTCFALMFLKRTNLAHDLTGSLKTFADPGEKILKSGGVGGDSLKGGKPLAAVGIGAKPERDKGKGEAGSAEEKAAERLGQELVRARAQQRKAIIEKLRDSKGSAYTDALAAVIPKLDTDGRKMARGALADRLTRMRPATLRLYFKEKDAELRCGAALAAGQRDAKELIPELIGLLDDADGLVQRAAHASLKALAGKDLGTKSAPWLAWWDKQSSR